MKKGDGKTVLAAGLLFVVVVLIVIVPEVQRVRAFNAVQAGAPPEALACYLGAAVYTAPAGILVGIVAFFIKKHRLFEEHTPPICLAFSFHLLVHFLGIFTLLTLPHSFRMGASNVCRWSTPFGMLFIISLLNFLWFSCRAATLPRRFPGRLAVIFIPVIMSLGTAEYCYCTMGYARVCRQMLEDELIEINGRIEQATQRGSRVYRHDACRQRELQEMLREETGN
ncbi:MAG: hypothetical protein ACOX9C_00440 [Kiritimatiellia bacterium]|jgi:hypothetical protein